MGPKYNDADDKEWDTWQEWKLPEKSSHFEYNADPPEVGPKHWPEPTYQENPEKM